MILRTLLIVAAVLVVAAVAEPGRKRKGKFFNLFNVVTFDNGPCRSTDSISGDNYRNGTCLTSTECSDRGGSIEGNCAAGFGSCCVFKLTEESTGTVTQNCTYIQNNGFPSAMTGTNSVMYTVEKCDDDVCDLRLDFETFSIQGPADTLETNGGTCTDSLVIESSTGGLTYPTVCGELTGQHMYINLGEGSGTATLDFTFSGTSSTRQFEIKITQMECNNENRPPDGCLQYHVGTQGRITSFNFHPTTTTTHLASQSYSACIRQEEGFNCVQYSVCTDMTFPFTLQTSIGTNRNRDSLYDTQCSEDYVVIEQSTTECSCGASNVPFYSRYCGVQLNAGVVERFSAPICDCSAPFYVRVETDATADGTNTENTSGNTRSAGVCLDYRQIAC